MTEPKWVRDLKGRCGYYHKQTGICGATIINDKGKCEVLSCDDRRIKTKCPQAVFDSQHVVCPNCKGSGFVPRYRHARSDAPRPEGKGSGHLTTTEN